jgi:cytochrome c
MNKHPVLAAAIAVFSMPALASNEAGAMKLAEKSGCLTCHAIDKAIIGPAWRKVGSKYASDSNATEQLAIKVKKGTEGTWGQIPMPGNATVKDSDIKTLVAFILTLQ